MLVSNRSVVGIVVAHVVATWFMVGLIWTVHHLHYPLLGTAGRTARGPEGMRYYDTLQSEHVDRIGALLLLPWLTEGLTLLGLLAVAFLGGWRSLRLPALVNGAAMVVVLAISGFWSAPAHGRLLDGFDASTFDRLMAANLLRTLAWTVCGTAALWALVVIVRESSSHGTATS
jgi:hypothetical protein